MTRTHPNPPESLPTMADNFARQAILAEQEAKSRLDGLKTARQVTSYYETPIARPTFPTPDPRNRVRVNHKELLMLTGYFDPADKSADFKHTWQKLLDYGTMNDFQEEHYLQALGSILRGEAYEIFTEYKQFHRTLKETLDYFSGVYTKKRSLADDRKAVDEFTRRKGESIVVCMERAILAIDRLRLVHPTDGWEALRQQMRHNILMQVVKEETKRALQMEVDNVHEDTGMPYDFNKLIRFADRYERNHNTQPKDEVTTLFKVASGGLKHSPKPRNTPDDQLAHLKKDVSWQKQFSSIQADIKELKANEARYYKNEGRGSTRESRRTERDSRSRTDRSQSLDRLRGITSSSAPRPTSTSTSRPVPTTIPPSSTPRPTSIPPRPAYTPPDPYARREQSKSPPRRNQTPYTYDRDRPRSSSYSRDRNYSTSDRRPYSGDRNNSSSNRRPYSSDRDRERSRNYSSSRRDYSRDRGRSSSRSRYENNNKPSSSSRPPSRSHSAGGGTELVSNSGSKTVIITINGQEYIPLRKEN